MTKRHTELTQQDLRFYPTEDLTDSDNGGGLMVRDPLTGADNELFTPISDQARTLGQFNARSVHAAVRVPSRAKLGGAHVIISKPAKAGNVSHLLYRGVKYGERRRDIIKRIAAYAVATIESRMTLLSTQSLGSRIVQAYQRTDEPLPQVGDVYCLRQDKRGYPEVEQYIQVIRVSSLNRTFTDVATGKDFVRTVVKLELSTALTSDFVGVDYPSIGYADAPCKLRETHIADGAQYYGVKPLAAAIKAGVQTLRVPSLMEKLVPTSQVETSLTDLTAAGQQQLIFDAASGESVLTRNMALNDAVVLYAGNAITPRQRPPRHRRRHHRRPGRHAVQRRARRRHRRLRPWRAALQRDRRLWLVDAVFSACRRVFAGGRYRQHWHRHQQPQLQLQHDHPPRARARLADGELPRARSLVRPAR